MIKQSMCSLPSKISLCSVPALFLSASLQQLYLFWCLSFGSLKGSVSYSAARGTVETAAFLLVEKWVVFTFTISTKHAWHTYKTKKCACVEQGKLNLHRFHPPAWVAFSLSVYTYLCPFWCGTHLCTERDAIFIKQQVDKPLTERWSSHWAGKKKNSIMLREFVQAWRKESEQTSDEMAALLFTSCPCLWVTDPCRREQHRNREHYSEIKVDLELLPHHLAQAAGKSKRCRKWMNTQRG